MLESFDQLKTVGSNKDGLLYGVPVSIKENFAYKVICSYILLSPSPNGNYTDSILYVVQVCVFIDSYLMLALPVFILPYKNHDSSCGVIMNLEQPAQQDCVLVEVLKRQGSIPFVKTNLPQALLK